MEGCVVPCIPSFGANVGEKLHSFLALLPQKEALLQFCKCLESTAPGLDALEKRIFAPLSKFEFRSFSFLVIGALTGIPCVLGEPYEFLECNFHSFRVFSTVHSWMWRSIRQHLCFLLWKSLVEISSRKSANLTKTFHYIYIHDFMFIAIIIIYIHDNNNNNNNTVDHD